MEYDGSQAAESIDEIFTPERCILVLNPISTSAHLVERRVAGVRAEFGQDFIELTTEPDQEANIAALEETARDGDLIINGGGDGTMNMITNAVARSCGSLAQKQVAITSAGGGNGNDFYFSTLDKIRPVHEHLKRGKYKTFNPLEVLVERDGEELSYYAACYSGMGLTGDGALGFTATKHRTRRFYKNNIIRLGYEAQLLTNTVLASQPFVIEQHGRTARMTEISAVNGPRMAKMGRLPVRLTEPEFYAIALRESKPAAFMALGALACGVMPGKRSSGISFNLLTDTLGHVDAETFPLYRGDAVRIQQSKQPITFLSTRKNA